MSIPQPIHPFPARMAPSIALDEVQGLEAGSVVLDPMMGSGTVVRVATDHGHRAIGRDVDPLAVLMARVWTTPIDTRHLRQVAAQVVQEARHLAGGTPQLPWIDEDADTRSFVDYWFAQPQQDALRRISSILVADCSPVGEALRVALSRTIITKDHGASLARDVSHSRPHRAFERNDYAVYDGFLHATERLARRLDLEPPRGNADVAVGDARALAIPDASVDAVITSPPYLNAIDYLRGHRLSLVWLGHRLNTLRAIRAASIGAERAPDAGADVALAGAVMRKMRVERALPSRERRMVERYILDLATMLREIRRVLRPGGRVAFVLGNSCIRGVFVRNSTAVSTLARELGFTLVRRRQRTLPPSRRYMPPPQASDATGMERRMRTEIVLTYVRE